MRRLVLVVLAPFFATGLAVSASLFNVSSAAEGTTEPPPRGGTHADASAPYSQIVDNAKRGRFRASGWEKHPADAQTYGEDYATAEPSADPASFRVTIPEDDYYSVYARWPTGPGNAAEVRFGVPTAS